MLRQTRKGTFQASRFSQNNRRYEIKYGRRSKPCRYFTSCQIPSSLSQLASSELRKFLTFLLPGYSDFSQFSLIFSTPEGPDRRQGQGLHYHKTGEGKKKSMRKDTCYDPSTIRRPHPNISTLMTQAVTKPAQYWH